MIKRLLTLMLISVAFLVLKEAAIAQQNDASQTTQSQLIRLLQTKGIITEEEAVTLNYAASPAEANLRLAKLLLSKGVISQHEYQETVGSPEPMPSRVVTAAARVSEAPESRDVARAPASIAGPKVDSASAPTAAAPVQAQLEGPATTQSKIPVKIYGSLLLSSNYVDRGANTIDVPLWAQKRGTSSDQNHQNVNFTARQSRFGLRYEGSIFKDAKLTGVFEFDLLGGKPSFANGVNFDIFRVRLAYGRIDWKNDSFEGGQDWAVFAPLNPTTLASYAIAGFSTSGNLWIRTPQIRYEHRAGVGEKSRFIITAALLDPDAGDNAGNPAARVIGLGERGSLPAFETRLAFAGPTHGKESSGGISGHYSRLLGVPGNPVGTTRNSPIDSYGLSGDFNLWFSSGFRVSGEAFHGRALGIFSGEVAQSSVVIGGRARGINSTGGWAELHGEAPSGYTGAWQKFSANFGYGIEDNRDEDLIVGIRKRNQTFLMNGQYKFSPNFTFALEYRRVMTDWFRQSFADQKMNWANLSLLYSF